MPTNTKRVLLKFRDTVQLPYADDIGNDIEQQGIGLWRQLEQQHPGMRILRLYRSIDEVQLKRLVERAVAHDHGYQPPNFLTFFVIELPAAVLSTDLARTLRTWPLVEFAYDEPEAHAPTAVNPGSYALNPYQSYQDAAPIGIDARCAWNIPGGDGQGQTVIDLEAGWTLDHDDFVAHLPTLLFGAIEDSERSHGTSVLGVICAVGNPAGIVGIAPNVQAVNVVSYKRDRASDPVPATIPEAIAQAALNLSAGNVLLVEVELGFYPCETDPSCFAAIRLATAAGICVVEPAGNAGKSLDLFMDAAGHPVLSRVPGNTWFQDSFAIIVAAASTVAPHTRKGNSNFGTRIDCYAWGDSVATSSSTGAGDKSSHTVPPEFVNTSAAAAIITGAALSVQGMREAAGLPRFDPAGLRATLGTGTGSTDPIGVMPDLCAIGSSITVKTTEARPAAPTHLRIIG